MDIIFVMDRVSVICDLVEYDRHKFCFAAFTKVVPKVVQAHADQLLGYNNKMKTDTTNGLS
jgi:hypothetical protein